MGLTKGSSLVITRRDLPAYAERVADRTVVWLNGEHDASTVAALWDTIGQAIALDDDVADAGTTRSTFGCRSRYTSSRPGFTAPMAMQLG